MVTNSCIDGKVIVDLCILLLSLFRYSNRSKSCLFVFSNAEYGVAAGQACVFYEENRVLGGGWILRDN